MVASTGAYVRADAATATLLDGALVAFLQGVELAASTLYAQVSIVLGSPAATEVARSFAAHHRAHARAFGELAGPLAVSAPPPGVLNALQSTTPLTSEREGLTFLYGLEGRLAATHHYVLGRLGSTPTIALGAATLPVECQHAVVLGTLLSLPLGQLVPTAQGDDGHLVPEQYPRP